MNNLLIHPAINYQFLPVKLELFQPMDSILFHFVSHSDQDIDGFNLFSIDPYGLNFKRGVSRSLGELDLQEEGIKTLKVIGIDLV